MDAGQLWIGWGYEHHPYAGMGHFSLAHGFVSGKQRPTVRSAKV